MIPRPTPDEYAPFYAGYVGRVPAGDVEALLGAQLDATLEHAKSLLATRADFAYAPGKWTVREVVGHLADAERIFTYRMLRIARGDLTPLPGFEQQDYVRAGGFDRRSLANLADELQAIRRATVALVASLDPDALARRGIASGAEITVRALVYIVVGHERHHLEVLRARYR
ncbi:MAG: DinB family protein [Gemmatimonadaceae bacterium]